jgi:hypothetical protein
MRFAISAIWCPTWITFYLFFCTKSQMQFGVRFRVRRPIAQQITTRYRTLRVNGSYSVSDRESHPPSNRAQNRTWNRTRNRSCNQPLKVYLQVRLYVRIALRFCVQFPAQSGLQLNFSTIFHELCTGCCNSCTLICKQNRTRTSLPPPKRSTIASDLVRAVSRSLMQQMPNKNTNSPRMSKDVRPYIESN